MSESFSLEAAISYWNVDRDQLLTLDGLFKLFQEAAIKHADLHDVGSHAMLTRGESWVLNRIAARILRYPRYEEQVRVHTWSAGISGFKGYRELRLLDGEELLASATSFWLYVNMRTKSFVRVPQPLAESFPERKDDVYFPNIDRLRLEDPGEGATQQAVSLRYSDIDSNGHVNNASYFDYLQTALVNGGLNPRPSRLEIHFQREIAPSLGLVNIALSQQNNEALVRFGSAEECFTRAHVAW